jgi:hypothetical protein
MNNLTKTAKTLDKICHVVQVLFKVAAIAAAIGFVMMLLMPTLFGVDIATYSSDMNSLDIGILEMELSENAPINFTLAYLQGLVVLAMSGVCVFIGSLACTCIRAILNPMTEGHPFSNTVSTNLKKLSNLTIWVGIATNLTLIVEGMLTVFAYNLGGLMNPDLVTHISINYDLDLTFMLYFGVLRLLSYIFRYGEELQQLSDETL